MNPWDWWPETEHNMMTLSETLLHMWLLSFGIPAMRDMFSRTDCVVRLVVVVAYTECDDLRVWTIFCAKYLLYKLYGWSYGTLRKDMRKNIECEICYINYLLYKSWISRSNFLELCHNFYEAISFSFEICRLYDLYMAVLLNRRSSSEEVLNLDVVGRRRGGAGASQVGGSMGGRWQLPISHGSCAPRPSPPRLSRRFEGSD